MDWSKETYATHQTFPSINQDQNTNWEKQTKCWAIVKCGLRIHQHTCFAIRVSNCTFLMATKLWIKKKRSPTMRHVSRTHTFNSSLIVRQNQFGTRNPNLNMLTQTIRWRADQKKFHAWRVQPSISFLNIMIFRCFLVAISTIFFLIRSENKEPRPRKVQKRLPMKVYRWRKRNQWFGESETHQFCVTETVECDKKSRRRRSEQSSQSRRGKLKTVHATLWSRFFSNETKRKNKNDKEVRTVIPRT